MSPLSLDERMALLVQELEARDQPGVMIGRAGRTLMTAVQAVVDEWARCHGTPPRLEVAGQLDFPEIRLDSEGCHR